MVLFIVLLQNINQRAATRVCVNHYYYIIMAEIYMNATGHLSSTLQVLSHLYEPMTVIVNIKSTDKKTKNRWLYRALIICCLENLIINSKNLYLLYSSSHR